MRKGQFIREVREIDTLGRKCRNMNVEKCQIHYKKGGHLQVICKLIRRMVH